MKAAFNDVSLRAESPDSALHPPLRRVGGDTNAAPRFIPSVAFTPEVSVYVIPIGSAA